MDPAFHPASSLEHQTFMKNQNSWKTKPENGQNLIKLIKAILIKKNRRARKSEIILKKSAIKAQIIKEKTRRPQALNCQPV